MPNYGSSVGGIPHTTTCHTFLSPKIQTTCCNFITLSIPLCSHGDPTHGPRKMQMQYDRKHLHSNAVVSPVNAVGSHRTPSDGAHFGHAQNKRRGSNTRALDITVGSSYQRSKVSYNAIRAPRARTMVVVQTPRSSVVFARRFYGVL